VRRKKARWRLGRQSAQSLPLQGVSEARIPLAESRLRGVRRVLTNPHNIFAFISDACTSVQLAHRVRSTPHPRTWSTSLPFSLSRQGMGPCEAGQVRGREGHCFRTQQGLAHQKWWMIPRSGGISYRCRDGVFRLGWLRTDDAGADRRPHGTHSRADPSA